MRWLASLFLLVLHPAQAQTPPAPWRDAALVGAGTAGGLALGAIAGQVLPIGEAGWIAASAGAVGGAVGGTYVVQRRLGLPPDVRGALAGAALDGLAGVWIMNQGPEGQSLLWGAAGVLGGAVVGHRLFYVPRDAAVSFVPVATPNGSGVYAVVRF